MNENDKEKNSYDKEIEELLNSYSSSSSKKDKFNLSISFDDDSFNEPEPQEDFYSAPHNDGGIYFSQVKSNHPPRINENTEHKKAQTHKRTQTQKKGFKKFIKSRAGLIILIIVMISTILSIIMMSCLNDVLAFNKSEEVITVTVPDKATTNQLINILHKKKLIKHEVFCKMFMKKSLKMSDSTPKYISGVYYLTPKMGVETMLFNFRETKKAETVTLTFPEGYTIDEIAEKLAKYGVCTQTEFYKNLNKATFDYDFVKKIDNKSERYHYLEGYLYPDTYEFFIGENPSSVIRKLLNNYNKKWTAQFSQRAKELGMTEDEVITLASIIQKEAADTEDMSIVSSVFHNRLNSINYPSLQSDATNYYLNTFIKPNIDDSLYPAYQESYSTYYCKALPIGPICSPGMDAIKAALYPASTNYYYFCYDKNKKIYTAKTEAEHNQNVFNALNAKDDTSDEG